LHDSLEHALPVHVQALAQGAIENWSSSSETGDSILFKLSTMTFFNYASHMHLAVIALALF
jgi:hypothetical protein